MGFPGGSMVKNLPSKAGDAIWSLLGELGSHMPDADRDK